MIIASQFLGRYFKLYYHISLDSVETYLKKCLLHKQLHVAVTYNKEQNLYVDMYVSVVRL